MTKEITIRPLYFDGQLINVADIICDKTAQIIVKKQDLQIKDGNGLNMCYSAFISCRLMGYSRQKSRLIGYVSMLLFYNRRCKSVKNAKEDAISFVCMVAPNLT